MFERLRQYLNDYQHKRQLQHWQSDAELAQKMSMSDLRALRNRASQVRRRIDAINHIAVSRLTLPVIGSNAIRTPARTEWAHRPEAWTGPVSPTGIAAIETKTSIGNELTIFHDCPATELSLRQVRNKRKEDLAPFGIRMDVFNFAGSFLSLVVEMPPEAVHGLKRSHLLRLNMIVDSERPQEMFARLNLRHGPNTEQIVRELDIKSREIWVEFDLYYTQYNENRGDRMWIDLIFEGPSMNMVTIRDMTLIRRPRTNI